MASVIGFKKAGTSVAQFIDFFGLCGKCPIKWLPDSCKKLTKFVWHRFRDWKNWRNLVFSKSTIPGLFFIYLRSWSSNNTIIQKNKSQKWPTLWWDFNSQPLDYQSHPITTRPGLLPVEAISCSFKCCREIIFFTRYYSLTFSWK